MRSVALRGGEEEEDDDDVLSSAINALFNLFDEDNNGVVDFTELCVGLSTLCGGSIQDKASSAFALFDYDDNGVITLEEMTRYLTSIFKVAYATGAVGDRGAVDGCSSYAELAERTANEVFAFADLDHDGNLTFDEFLRWSSGDTTSGEQVEVASKLATSKVDMDEFRRLSGWRPIRARMCYVISKSRVRTAP